jgi:hypothetical protein
MKLRREFLDERSSIGYTLLFGHTPSRLAKAKVSGASEIEIPSGACKTGPS